ncbi:hypothetical protein KDAU_31760 [Dictyobacter aurantiacus]|uniref:Uncharacterized protein n=1 Tax=Dictyobacter aurantiacus TaxID=1936993 RepID=A0A401ZG47_9CHLR|nr:hypothetical protein KDAU_31760 [Dictyobacter aurantiacus]
MKNRDKGEREFDDASKRTCEEISVTYNFRYAGVSILYSAAGEYVIYPAYRTGRVDLQQGCE